jgi:hypothetical protein
VQRSEQGRRLVLVVDAAAVLADYALRLKRQPLAERSRDAYLAQVTGFVTWLADSAHGAEALSEANVRDWAVRDYKRYVKAQCSGSCH